jgi:predicted ATP-dependent Lon-type protease
MEDGQYRGDLWSGKSSAGIVLIGNVDEHLQDKHSNLTEALPVLFKTSGVLDRFYG